MTIILTFNNIAKNINLIQTKPKCPQACLKPIRSEGSTGIEGSWLEPEPAHRAGWIRIPGEYCIPYLFCCTFYTTLNLNSEMDTGKDER